MDATGIDEASESETVAKPGLSDCLQKHYDDILDLNRQVVEARYQYEVKKDRASAAKKELDVLQGELNDLITQGPNPQKELPFPDDASSTLDWQIVPIDQVLQLTAKQLEKLADAGIRTVGEFEETRSGQRKDYPDGITSIKGVGVATADEWENQMLDWLAENARESTSDEE